MATIDALSTWLQEGMHTFTTQRDALKGFTCFRGHKDIARLSDLCDLPCIHVRSTESGLGRELCDPPFPPQAGAVDQTGVG
eukprot:2827059-Pyramimonas_sp.AAC.1